MRDKRGRSWSDMTDKDMGQGIKELDNRKREEKLKKEH